MQYFCKNKERRLRVSQSVTDATLNPINGIDYLEVVSSDQKTLEIHFLHPLPGEAGGVPNAPVLETKNILIEGGVRIQNIEVDTINAVAKVLTVTVYSAGDFSTYTLRLVKSPTDLDAPLNFDPQLSSIDFSFKANCPSDFDCKTEDNCQDEKLANPRINYLAKDYSSFRRLALDRLSLLMPDWQERSAADLQIALVELMAYTGDYLSYYQDAVATEAYLFKARKRISARRHARLLDYHVHNGCNSRTWIFIEVEQGGNADNAQLNASTILFTKGANGKPLVNNAMIDKVLKEPEVQVFETKHKLTLMFVHNEIEFYTWDDSACCLPRGATQATLYRSDGQALSLEVGEVLVFEEIKSPTTGREPDANPIHRHAVRLTSIEESTDILNGTDVLEIEWHEVDALPFPLCISAKVDGALIDNISVARGNIILADHGMTISNNALIPNEAPENGDYRPLLAHRGITVSSVYQHDNYIAEPASYMLRQDPHNAIPEIVLSEDEDIWKTQRDLLGSDRFAQEFVAEIESDQTIQLRFGDDVLGKKPGEGFQPSARYRIGNGVSGNIGAESIGRIHWNNGGVAKVRNPLPAKGGQNAETIEEVKQFAPEAFKTQERAVTEADYVAKTELHPQVQKALATFRWTGSWHTVFLTIDRKNGFSIDDQFKNEIYTHLEKYRMAGYDLEIRPPKFVPLEIEMKVCVKTGYFRNAVKQKLQNDFSRFDLPNGTRGFFHPDIFTFGQAVYLSTIYQTAMKIDGVASVELKTFKRLARASNLEKENGVLQPEESEIIRLDNDPNFPENGKINFLMFGGL